MDGTEVLCIPHPNVYLLRQIIFHVRALAFLFNNWTTINMILFYQMSAPWILPLRLVRFALRSNKPLLVMDIRTVPMGPEDKATFKDSVRRVFESVMNRTANRWADGQTAITQRMAETVRIPPQKLWGVWPSGVDLDQFSSASIVRRWPEDGEPVTLVYVGALHYERNLMSLCRAVERANAEGMAFALALIGEGTQRFELEGFASQTEGRVYVMPPVPHDQVPGMLARAHVGVLPFPDEDKFRVSSPIKLFEYLGAGLPILATRVACHTDVVGSGKYVFWAEDGSVEGLLAAVRLIWHGRRFLDRMGREAARAARAWTWQASALKLKAALEYGLSKASQ